MWQRMMALVSPLCGLMVVCGSSRLNEALLMFGMSLSRAQVLGHLAQFSLMALSQNMIPKVFHWPGREVIALFA